MSYLHLPLPDILAVQGVHHPPVNDHEGLLKPLLHLPPPLVLEMARHHDEDAAGQVAEFEFLDDQPGHDRFARAGVVGDEETDARQPEHVPVNPLDLMGERVNLGDVHRQQGIVEGGKAVAAGFQAQENLAGRSGEVGFHQRNLQLGQFLAGDQLIHVLPGAGGSTDQTDISAQVLHQLDLHRLRPARALDDVTSLDFGH